MIRTRPPRTRWVLFAVVASVGALVVTTGLAIGVTHRADVAERDAALLVSHAAVPLRAAVDDAVAAALAPTADVVTSFGTSEEMEGLAAVARDTGDAVLTPPLPAGVGSGPDVVAPRYRDPMPRTTAARREQLVGYAVVPVALDGTLDDLAADGSVRVTDGGAAVAVVGDPGRGGQRAVERIEVLGREWRIEARSTASFPAGTGLATAASVGLVVVGGLVLFRWNRRFADGDEALASARHEGRLLTELAAVLQATLDLSDVCPAFATLLFEQLPVDGVGIELIRDDGTPRTIFALGRATDPEVVAVVEVPPGVGAGTTVALAMERDRRLHGALRLRATGEFSDSDRRIAVVAAQLAGAAIDNATAHARQNDALRRLAELDDMKNVFLGTAAHELRTPVTAITGFSTMLRDRENDLSPDQRSLLIGRLAENAARLRLLVEDLLDLSRLDSGRMVEANERLHLGRLVGDVVSDLAPILADRVLDLDLEAATDVDADRAALERIVSNLVSNAAKFSPERSTVHVAVVRSDDGRRCRLVVEDEGPGVPESERARIFSRFYRGKGEEVVRTRGTGIGLSVVHELVRMLGGTVMVEDGAIGARFVVELPAAVEEESRAANP